jgi:hypothetical protein
VSAFPSAPQLSECDEATVARDRDALAFQLAKHDFNDPDVLARGLNVSADIATWLRLTGGATYWTLNETLAFTPVETFPSAVAKALVSFRKLITWCESNGRTELAPNADLALEAGVANQHQAQWLVKNITYGPGYTSSSIPNVARRIQSLSTIGCTPSTVAAAIAAEVEDVVRWLGTSDPLDLPWQTTETSPFGDFLRVLRFLASGPTYLSTAPNSKAVRAGQVY